jgi:hypothetical protein
MLESTYKERNDSREKVLMESTMALVSSFITDGSTEDEAKDKVRAFSNEITTNAPGAKYDFVLGNTQPLKDAVQASVLADMTQAKKDIVLNILNTAV